MADASAAFEDGNRLPDCDGRRHLLRFAITAATVWGTVETIDWIDPAERR
ncbi:MAG: hypothetical protein OJF58_001683 [Enhydrobacter sp.]|nr:MAG: hypothetical protein OJF58_001683 [Enhydrobacter sp.]